MNQSNQRVVVLGASDKADRYSNQAFRLLKKMGHDPVPVNRNLDQIEGVKVLGDLSEISGHVDTLTMYVNRDDFHRDDRCDRKSEARSGDL